MIKGLLARVGGPFSCLEPILIGHVLIGLHPQQALKAGNSIQGSADPVGGVLRFGHALAKSV